MSALVCYAGQPATPLAVIYLSRGWADPATMQPCPCPDYQLCSFAKEDNDHE